MDDPLLPDWQQELTPEVTVTEDDPSLVDGTMPAELRQRSPWKTRLAAISGYLVGNMLVSAFFLAAAVTGLSRTAKEVRNGRELARDGRLAYTADVQSGGLHLATVYYSFIYNGTQYRGEAILPQRYLNRINEYSKSGDVPVLFLPADPSISYPDDWRDDESYSSAFIW